MKLLRYIVLCCFLLLSMLVSGNETVDARNKTVLTLERNVGYGFTIPEAAEAIDRQAFLTFLRSEACRLNANLFRSLKVYGADGGVELWQYCLLNDDTRLMEPLGEWHDLWNQWPGAYTISLLPFDQVFDFLTLSGAYYVEIDAAGYDTLLSDLLTYLNERTDNEINPAELTAQPATVYDDAMHWTMLPFVCLPLLLALVLYDMARRSDRAALMQLNGCTLWQAFLAALEPLFLCLCAAALPAAVMLGLVCRSAYMLFCVGMLWLTVGLCLLFFGISWKCRQLNSKNWRESKLTSVFALYCFIKLGATCLLLTLTGNTLLNLGRAALLNTSAAVWENAADYATFSGLYVGYDETEIYKQVNRNDFAMNDGLYPYLNNMGAVYCMAYRSRSCPKPVYVINPNYLAAFPLMDAAGNPIVVSEEEASPVLLCPSLEDAQWAQAWLTERRRGLAGLTHTDLPKQETVRVILLAADQKLFTFMPGSEYEREPVVQVITQANSLTLERGIIFSGAYTDPLKIRLVNHSAAQTYQLISPKLMELGLADNLKYLAPIGYQITEQRRAALREIAIGLGENIAVMAALACFDVALLSLYFALNKRRMVLKITSGQRIVDRYRLYFTLLAIQTLAVVVFWMSTGLPVAPLTLVLCLILAENAMAFMVMRRREARGLLRYLKEA